MKTAQSNNQQHTGYYKFVATTPRELRWADKLISKLGMIRLHSSRIKKPVLLTQ